MKVVLVNTPCNHDGALSDTWYQPLGLAHIATFLEENGIDVEIADGVVLGLQRTLDRCSGDIVGIGFNCFNIGDMEAVAEKAKSQSTFTVLGGHAASAMADLLLAQNPNIDAVVVGDGEWAMLGLVAMGFHSLGDFNLQMPGTTWLLAGIIGLGLAEVE